MTTRYHELEARLYDRRYKPPRPVDKKKVSSNTYLIRSGEDINIKLYNTNILTFRPNNTVTINTGSWPTYTTKNRMNDFIGPHVQVYSDHGTWRVRARQVEKHQTVHWREEIQWTHTVYYEFYDGMSFDVGNGLLVWNPYQWEPLEYISGMLQAPVVNRLDALEAAIDDAIADEDKEMTVEFINEVVNRNEMVRRQYDDLRRTMEQEVKTIEWRMETTLARTMSLFSQRADVQRHKNKARHEGWCEQCQVYGHRNTDAHQLEIPV
jgi:hypothetical protein